MQVHVTSGSPEYRLDKAILIYKSGVTHGGAYASLHDVTETNGAPIINPGVPLTKRSLLTSLQALAPKQYGKPELLPDNALAKGQGYLSWWSKPSARQLWFDAQGIGNRSGEAPCPALVWIVANGKWMVFALNGSDRPTAQTPLFQAPFFNVWSSGGICVGNVKTPSGAMRDNTEAWEEAFFRSYFTHPNIHTPKGLTRYKGGPTALWRDLMDGKRRTFPVRSLVPLNRTLEQVFNAAMAGKE